MKKLMFGWMAFCFCFYSIAGLVTYFLAQYLIGDAFDLMRGDSLQMVSALLGVAAMFSTAEFIKTADLGI